MSKTLLVQIESSKAGELWHPNIWYKNRIGTFHHVKPVNSYGVEKLSVIGSEHGYENMTYKIMPDDVMVIVPTDEGRWKIPYRVYEAVTNYAQPTE